MLARGGRTREDAAWRVQRVINAEGELRSGQDSMPGDEFGFQVSIFGSMIEIACRGI